MNKLKNDYLPRKLLWVDLEMTGLEPATDKIIELAAIVTDFEFKEIDSLELIINQPEQVIEGANEWSRVVHEQSGLWQAVRKSQIDEKKAQQQLVELIDKHFDSSLLAVLSGNSIHQDRRFIREAWPEVESRLHYRMLDISTFKLIGQSKYGLFFNKSETHRALDDIRESIAELKYYLNYFKKT